MIDPTKPLEVEPQVTNEQLDSIPLSIKQNEDGTLTTKIGQDIPQDIPLPLNVRDYGISNIRQEAYIIGIEWAEGEPNTQEAAEIIGLEASISQEPTETPDKEEDDKLNPNQELFCQYYATDREFFGNGTQTYLEVYQIDRSKRNWYKTAQAAASRLLSNVIICKRINELIEANGLNDNYVDKQLEFLVTQHADFKSKLGAIKEYNQLKQRIINRLDHTTLGEKLPDTKTILIDTRPQEEKT